MFSQALNKLEVLWMVMTETGTYNPVYARPYQTHMDGSLLTALVDRVESSGGTNITEPLIAGLACQLVSPSAAPQGSINIQNGWNTRRIRFTLCVQYELSTGSIGCYYIQGYTSHPGVTISGAVDPSMIFFINSFTSVSRIMHQTPMGMQYIDKVQDSAQVFTGPDGSLFNIDNPVYGMRPEDIYYGIHAGYLSNGAALTGDELLDGRAIITARPTRSVRQHNVPAHYLGQILNTYMTSKDLSTFGQGNEDIITRAIQSVSEPSLQENFFFSKLAELKQGYRTVKMNWADLQAIDPMIDQKTRFVTLGTATKTGVVHTAGQTEFWEGSGRNTQISSMLSTAIPSMMMEHMLSNVQFRSTNHDIGGRITTVIIDAKSLTNMDMRRQIDLFKTRFEREIVPEISLNGHDGYMLEMKCDLFGETWIKISLGNEPITDFVVPSFCDALFSPVLSPNQQAYQHVVHDISHMTSYVDDEIRSHANMAQNSSFSVDTRI